MTWRTLSAEHNTLVSVRLQDGSTRHQRVRGILALERPDRLRLRVLGPASVTLFDLLASQGKCSVVSWPYGTAPAQGSPASQILRALCHDLLAAYGLGPKPSPATTITYGDWRRVFGSLEPFRVRLENKAHGYSADIRVVRLAVDPNLPPDVFAPASR